MRSKLPVSVLLQVLTAVLSGWRMTSLAAAQEMEPRAFYPSPIGTNFILLGYGYSSGEVLVDPTLPVRDVNATIQVERTAYLRSFDLAGFTTTAAAIVPYVEGKVRGEVKDQPLEAKRTGFGDARFRLATNLVGGEPLTPREFAARMPSTTVGTALQISAPTGEYDSSRLVNIGTNRWGFKPEAGFTQRFGGWFTDGTAGAWLFTDNNDFFGDSRRSQHPLQVYQLHGGYAFERGLWLAVDGNYYTGGQTVVNGVERDDRFENTRFGATLSVPLSTEWSMKVGWSKAATTNTGGRFETVVATLQYRWAESEE